jgi:hypothetical protein
VEVINSSCMAGCERDYICLFGEYQPELFTSTSICFPLPQDDSLKEQVQSVLLALLLKQVYVQYRGSPLSFYGLDLNV